MKRIVVGMCICLILSGPVQASNFDGHAWMKLDDDFKWGYTMAIIDIMKTFTDEEMGSPERVELYMALWKLSRCARTHKLTAGTMKEVIDVYINIHPENRKDDAFTLAVSAIANLCR